MDQTATTSGCGFDIEKMQQELEHLSQFYKAIGAGGVVLPASKNRPRPVLIAVLPHGEEGERVISHSFFPIPKSQSENTAFLQFYTETEVPEPGLERGLLLECLSTLNDCIPVGRCVSVDTDTGSGQAVGLKWVTAYPVGQIMKQESFVQQVRLVDETGKTISRVLGQLADGRTLDEVTNDMI